MSLNATTIWTVNAVRVNGAISSSFFIFTDDSGPNIFIFLISGTAVFIVILLVILICTVISKSSKELSLTFFSSAVATF